MKTYIPALLLLLLGSCKKYDSSNDNSSNNKDSLDKGLVAYYPFNGNTKDSSGNGFDMTNNGASLTTDKNGNTNQAYYFDPAQSSYMVAPTSNNISFDTTLTISLWFKPISIAGNKAVIAKVDKSNATGVTFGISWEDFLSNKTWGIITALNTGQVSCDGLTNNAIPVFGLDYSGVFPSNEWSLLTYVYNGRSVKIYKNGDEIYSALYSGAISNCSNGLLYLGRWWDQDPQYFKGTMDDVRIYNRALSATQVAALFKLKN